jgi:hypothetical protein
MKLTTALLIAIPIEALNFRLLDVCSIIDGCDDTNFVQLALAHLSLIMHSPAIVLVLRSTLTQHPISKWLGMLMIVLNGYVAAVFLIFALGKLLKFSRGPHGTVSQT